MIAWSVNRFIYGYPFQSQLFIMLLFINPQKHRLSLAYHKSILIGASLSPCAFDPLLALDSGIGNQYSY